jgi:L-aspartate oxidase
MWESAGLERDAAGLRRAAVELNDSEAWSDSGLGEPAGMKQVAEMVVRAASARTESRGAHCRTDFPFPYSCWMQPLIFEGERMLSPRPVTSVAAGRW